MFESKYSKVLTVILIIVIVAIVGLLGFLGYDYYQNYVISKETSNFVNNFQDDGTQDVSADPSTYNNGDDGMADVTDPFAEIKDAGTSGVAIGGGTATATTIRKTYKGFGVLGTMEIPAINFKYPVLEKVTKKSIETSVAYLYGTGLNEPGNTVIIGHNYRNGLFFSNNKKLNINDRIFVTDNSGKKTAYTIYNKFETTPEDTSFYQRDTAGKSEITLSTCTDDSSARLIIFAKAE